MGARAEFTDLPGPLTCQFVGPGGVYEMRFHSDGRTSRFTVGGLGGGEVEWFVDAADRIDEGWELSGLTRGTEAIWGDIYWFVVRLTAAPEVEYWGDRVLVRTDPAAPRPPPSRER